MKSAATCYVPPFVSLGIDPEARRRIILVARTIASLSGERKPIEPSSPFRSHQLQDDAMMFAFGVFGIATVSYLLLRSVGEIAMEIRYENYKRKGLVDQGQQGPGDVECRPKLRVVGWPERPRRSRRRKAD